MTKKIFMALMILTLLLTGCGEDKTALSKDVPNSQALPVEENVPTFSAKTVDGRDVTNEIFAAKKITMVNIWGTFCPPCVAEMPDLGEMSRSMPDNAQIIGLVCDASEGSPQIQKAREILSKANADFVNIIPDEQLTKFMNGVEVVPTTIFVDGNGKVVGKVILGADIEGYKSELEKLLNE